MRGRRLWRKMEDGSKLYEVDKLMVDGSHAYAAYDSNDGNIEVVRAKRDDMQRKLFHEVVHKACDGMSQGYQDRIFGACGDKIDDREEALCEWAEGKLYDILVRNGWLKLPAPIRHPKDTE